MIRATFRIPREVTNVLGPFRFEAQGRSCDVALSPAPARSPPPTGGAEGAGAFIRIDYEPGVSRLKSDGTIDDAALAAEALDVLVPAINRVIHIAAYVGNNQKQMPLLSRFDLEDLVCEDHHDPRAPRKILLGGLLAKERILLKEPSGSTMGEVQRRLDRPSKVFFEAESLWHDSVEAFYDGRLREAVVLLRAAIEVCWRAAFEEAVAAYRRCNVAPLPTGVLDSYVERATDRRTSLTDRLSLHSKVVFDFSFREDWESGQEVKWGKLNSFFQDRHGVAHGTGQPSLLNAWEAVRLTREVLDKLQELTDAVVKTCP